MKRRRSVVLYWSFTYIMILLFSLVSMVLIYTATQRVVKYEIIQANNSVMENAAIGLDRNLLMVRSALYQLQEDYTLSCLNNVQGTFKQFPPYQTYQANSRMQSALLSLPFIKEILIFYPQTAAVVSSETAASAEIYHYTYLRPKGIPYDQWAKSLENVQKPSLLPIYSEEDDMPLLLYYVYPARNGMKLAAIIDTQKLISDVDLFDSDLYLINTEAEEEMPLRLLAAHPSNELDWREIHVDFSEPPRGESIQTERFRTGKNQRMVSCKKSKIQNLFYCVSTPYNVFYSWYFFTQRIMVFGMLMYLIIGIAVVFLSVRQQYRPVKKLIEVMEKDQFVSPPPRPYSGNEFIFLSDQLNGIRRGREAFFRRRQILEWESSLLRRIAQGEGNLLPRFYESAEKSQRENGAAFPLEGMACWLAAFYLCDYGVRTGNEMRRDPFSPVMEDYYTFSQMILRRTAAEQFSPPQIQPNAALVYLFDLKNIHLAAAFLQVENARDYLEAAAARICNEANAQSYMESDYVILPKACNLDSLPQGCADLMRFITEKELSKIKSAGEIPDLPSRGAELPSLFPPEVRRTLERFIRTHNIEKMDEMLVSLFRGYTLTGNATLMWDDFSLVISELVSFGVDFIRQTHLNGWKGASKVSQLINDTAAAENPVHILRGLLELFHSIADAFEAFSRNLEENSQQKKAADICGYIKRHYPDPNLSLSSLAAQFEMNINQLSKHFKSVTGDSVPDYINRVRIGAAKEILCSNKYANLDDLAAQVGYNNTKTLIRAFKRFEDTTPGQYRDLHRCPN